VHSNPLLIAVALAILGGVLIAPMGHWTQWSWPEGHLAPLGDAGTPSVSPHEGDHGTDAAPLSAPELSPEAAT
jgi:hypothetical protein